MVRSVYIASVEGNTGKSTVALGMLETLLHRTSKVGVFRPLVSSASERDYILELLLAHDGVDFAYEECFGVTYEAVHDDPDAALEEIMRKYRAVAAQAEAMVIVGSDYTDVSSPTELSFNARIAANLGAPVILVLGGRKSGGGGGRGLAETGPRTPEQVAAIYELAVPELTKAHASLLAVVVNRAGEDDLSVIQQKIRKEAGNPELLVWAIPEDKYLVAPTLKAVMQATDGYLKSGDPQLLDREVLGAMVAGMTMENVLARLQEGSVVAIPGDRAETLLAVLMAHAADTFPSLAGVILYGGFELSEPVSRLIAGMGNTLPIIHSPLNTYQTTIRLTETRGRLAADSQRKYDTALSLFEKHVDADALAAALELSDPQVVTPLMFEWQLIEQARSNKKHIVLPEGEDDRILRAASTILQRDVANLTILGEPFEVRHRAIELGLDISKAEVISPFDDVLRDKFAREYQSLREHKGMTLETAYDLVTDVSYFGTMMVHMGLADGMVSGAAHTTAHTIKPSFEIIKTIPDVNIVSSVFFMALSDRVLVYGDCAVVPDPDSGQLADIAISSAATASAFGIEPRIAMLSYSTGDSGTGSDVEKVRTATQFVRDRAPQLLVEGPIQYDAAADAAVAASKAPTSEVAGRATVFIFPDLNTGNNTYKAVQRSAGAVAIGPVLQGLRKPVNDLSRGALVRDIVNTVAITAVQAQHVEKIGGYHTKPITVLTDEEIAEANL